ncbi:MAG: hypothetical protein JO316_01170 [Abitibacteriaceae bacterium]|nr:hypothetical protein [Abditibacteriaceae bacterium]MBV9863940.1 hypothetical protein [Abditibacteriaceae bacterium]
MLRRSWLVRTSIVGLPLLLGWIVADGVSWKPRILRVHDGVTALAFAPDGERLAVGTSGNQVSLWALRYSRLQWQHKVRWAGQRVAFAPDGVTLASSGIDTQLWDSTTGHTLRALPERPWNNSTDTLSFWPDATTVAVDSHIAGPLGSRACAILLYDIHSSHLRRFMWIMVPRDYGISSALLSPDGSTVATGVVRWLHRPHEEHLLSSAVPEDREIWLWDVRRGTAGQRIAVLRPPATGAAHDIYPVGFSGDGRFLLGLSLGSENLPQAYLWDARSGQLKHTFAQSGAAPVAAAISPDSQMLAVGGLDGSVQLWDVATNRPTRTISAAHEAAASVLAFAPDGTTLATGSADETVKLWRVR